MMTAEMMTAEMMTAEMMAAEMMAAVSDSPSGRPRSVQTVRGMLLSLLVLVVGVLAVAGLAGQCSFNPGGPDTRGGVVPTVDAEAELRRLAGEVRFPVRIPQLPPSWRPNSASLERTGQGADSAAAVRAGWVSPAGNYLRLSQSSATGAELVAFEIGVTSGAVGVVDLQGTAWAVYLAPNGEPAWVADLGSARALITGSGDDPEMRTLAAATLAAPVDP